MNLDEKKKWWDNLSENMKLMAYESVPFIYGYKLRLNQQGLLSLVNHLEKYNLEIREREKT